MYMSLMINYWTNGISRFITNLVNSLSMTIFLKLLDTSVIYKLDGELFDLLDSIDALGKKLSDK